VKTRIEELRIGDRVCTVEDLDHDEFLTALQKSSVYLRTPITDGVASSVLEALVLGVPVVACENGTRPAGVVTYPAEDHNQLAEKLLYVISHRAEIIRSTPTVDVPDTLTQELQLLTARG
jgi:glycosyltransferase involved in cell wall biosynthesis